MPPDIEVRVVTTRNVPLLGPGIDLAIRYGGHGRGNGVARPLFQERVVPVGSPELVARHPSANDLSGELLLHVAGQDPSWPTWEECPDRIGLSPARGPTRRVADHAVAVRAALASQGLLLGWEANAGDLLREGRFVTLADAPSLSLEAFVLVAPEGPAGSLAS